ncbi:hypothetical protein [Microbispora sp. NPDC049125]|uniref:hypothetical protein n=1 Tax=Microbispora sp. NPDC049125 TaxID=3154929 RepID=UPI003466EF80
MGYYLRGEHAAGVRRTGLRYDEARDNFEDTDGRRHGWTAVTNDDGELFDAAGEVIPPESAKYL